MSIQSINLTPKLYTYLLEHSVREPSVLQALRKATQNHPGATMQISPEQGQLMALLVELTGAVKTLDIGTYTGYSALVVALALPTEGKVITCDVSQENTDVAKRFWEEAGVADKIDLHLAPAVETLQNLLNAGGANSFDFVFIDADKANYVAYYDLAFQLVRAGGIILVDNVLWDGRVADESNHEKDTNMIRALNEKIFKDKRVSITMIPIGDGLTVARKR